MKFILFLSFITILSMAGCQREKLNSKNLTTANVKRELPAPSGETGVTPDLPAKTPSEETKATLPLSQKATTTSRPGASKEPSAVKNVVKTTTKSYHIIAASHPRVELAEASLAKLKAQGYSEAQIIMKDNRYRVSVANFKDQQEASAQREVLMEKLGRDDLWIMVYR